MFLYSRSFAAHSFPRWRIRISPLNPSSLISGPPLPTRAAAATGAIAGAALVLGRRAIIDVTTALLAVLTLVLLVKTRKIPEPLVILGAGAGGILLSR